MLKCFLMEEMRLSNLWNGYNSMIHEQRKATEEEELKLLTPEQIIQRFPIALAQVKSGNNSENVLNETRKILCSLYQSKEIIEKSIQ